MQVSFRYNDGVRVALPTAEWVAASEFTIGAEKSYNVKASLSADIPSRMEVAFNLPSGGHDGLLALEVKERFSGSAAAWKDITLTD